MFVMSVVCCQVEVSATSRSLVQRSPTDCGTSFCVCSRNLMNEKPIARVGSQRHEERTNIAYIWLLFHVEILNPFICQPTILACVNRLCVCGFSTINFTPFIRLCKIAKNDYELCHICLSKRTSSRYYWAPNGRIFIKFYFRWVFKTL